VNVRGSQEIGIPKLRRGTEKARYRTGIAAMEDKEWCIQQGIWGVTKNHKEDVKDDEFPATTYKEK
jgi:hypothetical protein